jgi:uncharacterized membrane protein YgaE (UPF0421/DUF939 family)
MTIPGRLTSRFDRKHVLLLLYIVETLIGTGIGYYLYHLYPVLGNWSLISVVLVLAPDRKDAIILAVSRIKANLVGAAVGLGLFYLHPIDFPIICVGLAISIVACDWLGIQAATRTAMVAILIIVMHEPGKHLWEIAAERAGGVVLGCLIGVLITYLFHLLVQSVDNWRQHRHPGSASPPLPRKQQVSGSQDA